MKKGKVAIRKRIGAWLLALVMVASLVTVPAKTVEAAEPVTITNATDTAKDVYVELKEAKTIATGTWGTNSPAVDLTEYNVIIHNNTERTISDWTITLTLNDDSSWNTGWNGVSKSGTTITIGTYKGTDEAGEEWTNAEVEANGTVGGPGFQVAASAVNTSSVTITYNVGESSGSVSVDDTATDPAAIGSTSSSVTATITESNIADTYHEYYLQVNNGLSESISDWIVAIPLTGVSSSEQWDTSWAKVKTSYTSSYLYLSPSNSSDNLISQGSSFGSATDGNYKFNYKGSNAIDTSKAVVYYKTGSSTSGAFNAVVNNATQASGGSGSSGGTGGSGAVQGDTTTDLNLDVEYNFAKLLQYSLYFYDANMCGELEGKCSVDWRGNCHLRDKTEVKYNGKTVDVSGGFHDAGDHDKFGLPQGYTASILGIGYYEYKDAYKKTGQTSHFKTILDYFCDYFVRCTVLDDSGNAQAFCYQVGDGASHSQWVSAEKENIARPAYFADGSNPATDQVSEAAAALAIHYINFGNATYLEYAEKLFAMAKKNSKAAKSTDGGGYYSSSSWADDYCLAAAWLYKATEDETYLSEYNTYKGQVETGAWPSWDQVGPYALAYGSGDFSPLAANATATLNGTTNISNGYAWLCKWGSARYNCNMQLEGLIFDKNANKDQYTTWANGQMKFLLGNSADKRCYVVGYNANSSRYPHHRSSSGYARFPDDGYQTAVQAHVLTGALVGGIESSDGSYHDSSADYYCNEVAIDYNAAFTGAAAALYLLNEGDEDQMLDTNYAIDATATCPANEGGIAANGSEEITKTELKDTDITFPTATGIEYGQTLADAVLSKDSDDYGTYAWKDATIKPAVGAQTYEVVYTPTNTRQYDYSKLTGYDATTKTIIRTVTVTVAKKTITSITFPTVSRSVTAGTALKDVTLSKTSDDYGTFAWKTPTAKVTGAMTGAEVVYTLKDSANVEIASTVDGVNEAGTTVTRTVAFTVSKATPTVTVPNSIKTVVAGTKLSEISLTGCTASVSGSFTWKETDKELTYADNNTEYTIVFTPADTDSYNPVETKITLTVNKKTYDSKPAAPTLAGKTADSVTLEEYSGDGTVQYGYKSGTGTYTWQDTEVFTNLSPYTTYTFAMQFAGNDIYEASGAGDGLEVTTYYAEADCLKVNLSELTDKYVEAHNGTISYDSETKTLTLSSEDTYTITGNNPDVTIQCGKATVILDDATFKKLEATGDVVIQLEDDNVISSGITGTGTVTIENVNNTSAGRLDVTGAGNAAVEADKIVIKGGQITATGTGSDPALKAGKEIDLYGGALTANGEETTITPIVVDGTGKIVLDGCQVQSGAAAVYSPEPVDKDGSAVTLCTITYKDGDTTLHTYTAKHGATITLDNLAAKAGYKADGWEVEGTTDVLAPGTEVQVTEDVTYIAAYTEITGEIVIEAETADPLTVGYSADEGVKVTVTNNTNVTIDKITLTLDSDEDFTLSNSSISSLTKDASQDIFVKLKNGKGVNEEGYTVTVTASCKEVSSKDAVVTRKVVKKATVKPESAPEVASKTASSVTLTPVEGAEYGIKNGSAYEWQDSNIFTGLTSYTTYTFVFRYKEIDDTAASPASNEVTVTTYMSDTEKYIVDVSKVDNTEYVEAHNGTISVTDNVLTLEGEGTYTITGTKENLSIDTEENVTIILDDAVIKNVTGEKDVTIQLKGESTIESTDDSQSAVDVTGKVTITTDTDTTGSVTIQGGNNAAGITAGEVTITGGTVDVQGGSDAAGIKADTVDITGGTVSVTGQGDKPAVDAETKNIDSGVNVEIKNGDDYTESNPGENPDDPGEDPNNPDNPDNPGEDPGTPDPGEQKESVKKVESVKISISSTSIIEDTTLTATVTVLPADATDKSVIWSSTDTSVATVTQAGVITAVSEGATDIIATAKDGSNKSDKITVTVISNDNGDNEIKASAMVVTADVKNANDMPVKATMKLAPKKKMQLNVAFLPEEAEEEELTYTSSNTKIVKVDEDGEITAGTKAGTATITVTSENGLKKTFKVQVMQKAVTKVKLKASTKTVKVKKKLKVKVTLTPGKKQASDVVFWKSSNPDVATVTQAGVVKGIKKGKAKITAVAADGSGKKATLTITVK